MIFTPVNQRGYHLTVPAVGEPKVRFPDGADFGDRNFPEFEAFLEIAAETVRTFQKSTTRGRMFIQKDTLKISMYNCNKLRCTTIIYNRKTKDITVTNSEKEQE